MRVSTLASRAVFLVKSDMFSRCDSLNRARRWWYWEEDIEDPFPPLTLDQLDSEFDEVHGYQVILANNCFQYFMLLYFLPSVVRAHRNCDTNQITVYYIVPRLGGYYSY